MKTLAQEYGPYGITANVIATGPFDSELSRDYRASGTGVKTEEWYRAMLPAGRWGNPVPEALGERGGRPAKLGGGPRAVVRRRGVVLADHPGHRPELGIVARRATGVHLRHPAVDARQLQEGVAERGD